MSRVRIVIGSCLALAALCMPGLASADSAKCEILENGKPALGTFVVMAGDKRLGSGECGADAVKLAPGEYTVVVKLDGALDGPELRRQVQVAKGAPATARVDFRTAVLEVRIQREGRRAAGVVIVRRDGKQIGTLGGGVAAHLSAGSYEVVVRYRDQEQTFKQVSLEAGDKRSLEASF